MFIGKVLKAGTYLNKGPRKNQEALHVTVYIYIYIYKISKCPSVFPSQPVYLKCVVQSNVVTTKRCYFLDGQLWKNC